MLSFNLSKQDRIVLHRRIASSHIEPRELAMMSSTDLASEEAQESIRQAEQEALEHSILKKTLLPRTKITHKGLEDIEDVNENARREEREREQEEEERIERERQERLKLQAQRAQAAQGSVPPESPITPHAPPPSWMQAGADDIGSPTTQRPPLSLYISPTSEMPPPPPVEGELNLADLINIDEEPGQEVSMFFAAVDEVERPSGGIQTITDSPGGTTEHADEDPSKSMSPLSPPPQTPQTGISPFASRASYPEGTPRPSFDLNAIWSASPPQAEDSAPAATGENIETEEHEEPMNIDSPEGMKVDLPPAADPGGQGIHGHDEAHEQDFDMFLDAGEEEAREKSHVGTPEVQQANFETLPRVWSGKVCSSSATSNCRVLTRSLSFSD